MRNKRLKALLLSAYDAGSHKHWRQGIELGLSEIDWTVLTLPARYFSWRIRGNPISFIERYHDELHQEYDFIFATSIVDLATLKGLIPSLAITPALVYFHENQFEYPKSKHQKSLLEAQMVNLYSAMAADMIVFNSDYNRRSFFDGCHRLMKKLPDFTLHDLPSRLQHKSSVVPVPVADHLFEASKHRSLKKGAIKILWNHRWEYDKGPDKLLLFLSELEKSQIEFEVNIVGEQFRQMPPEFEVINTKFSKQIKAFGYVSNIDDYVKLLSRCDIVLSTAIHEFQGLAVTEAVAAGCIPLVPDRLSYVEYIDKPYRYQSDLSNPENEAKAAVATLLEINSRDLCSLELREGFKRFSWSELINVYRELIGRLVRK